MKWVPLHLHTHYSLLDGLSKPEQVASRCKELGYKTCAITDHGTISGAVSFTKAMKAEGIKPILGCEFYLSQQPATVQDKENRSLSHLVVLAKNKEGWSRLIEAASRSNDDDLYYYKPRLDLDILSEYCDGNLMAFSGHLGSDMANVLFSDWKQAYNSPTVDEVKTFLKSNWNKAATDLAHRYQEIFGADNFYIEIQLIDHVNSPAAVVVAECLREISKDTGIPPVATADSHYPTREDAADQRILLCSAMKTTLPKMRSKLNAGEDIGLSAFFKSNNYHIPSLEEMEEIHTEEELRNSVTIADRCEEYDILAQPMLPKFDCPEGYDEDEYLKQLCRDGWRRKLLETGKVASKDIEQKYLERIKQEMEVIKNASLSGYFLIVHDIVNYVRKNGWLPGPGRGSAAGCLVSYLMGITEVDPIEFDLLFERFYNAGRNTGGHISLPDIDIDVPTEKRDDVINHIRNKYGTKNVGQMLTFGRLQGRSAIKEVFRVHNACSFDEMNTITKNLPQEQEISDQLEDMETHSVIQWALLNQSDQLKDWCRVSENNKLEGKYAKLFEQAMRLEGTYKSQGKHAAGVVISSHNLSEVCPMVRDKKGSKVAGLEMQDLESMGHVKFDVLGINFLDKIMKIKEDTSNEL